MARNNTSKDAAQIRKDLAGNKILLLLTICFVAMATLIFAERVIDNIATMNVTYVVLRVVALIGVLGTAAAIFYRIRCDKNGKDERLSLITSSSILKFAAAFTLCACAILLFHITAIRVLYVLLPVYAGLYLIRHTYPKDFFQLAFGSVAAIALLYLLRSVESDLRFQSAFPVLLILLAATVVIKSLFILAKSKKGRPVKLFNCYEILPGRANPWFLTAMFWVFAISSLLYFPLGAASLLYGCYAIGAVFLAGALYYTYKLMSE